MCYQFNGHIHTYIHSLEYNCLPFIRSIAMWTWFILLLFSFALSFGLFQLLLPLLLPFAMYCLHDVTKLTFSMCWVLLPTLMCVHNCHLSWSDPQDTWSIALVLAGQALHSIHLNIFMNDFTDIIHERHKSKGRLLELSVLVHWIVLKI